MKFAHMADCHIGSWRDPKLRNISTEAFIKTVDKCIEEKVDFILIAGDLFNTSMPRLDNLKSVVTKFRELKENDISVYIVPGSHDFSPSGKTMLDVLEEAGLFINVVKGTIIENQLKLFFTIDKKTGAKITGLLGKRGSLEKAYFENLIKENLEKENGFKIFIFHSGLDEMKPLELKNILSYPLSLFPKNFNYYAGGHMHLVKNINVPDYGIIAYPGPLFPNNFSELENLERGGFYIYDNGILRWEPIQIYNVYKIIIDCNHKSPEQIESEIKADIKKKEFYNTLVLLRLHGTMSSGKPSNINFKDIFDLIYEKGAYFIMKNTNALNSIEFENIKLELKSFDDIEDRLINEHLGQIKLRNLDSITEKEIIKNLMEIMDNEKGEMTKNDFEKKVKDDAKKIFEIEL